MNSSVIEVRDDQRTPLLDQSPPPRRSSVGSEEEEEEEEEVEITPSSSSSNEPDAAAAAAVASPPKPNNSNSDPNQRLVSLDVFRGLTVALMIVVDDAGGTFPSINHSPWFGMTIADFVMPFFLFGVGISVGLVFKRTSNKTTATKKVILRAIKLFALGVMLQGGYFHGRNHLTYGVDITHIRWLGVLQRISIGYLLAAISEIWLATNTLVDSTVTLFKKYYIQWIVVILICSVYMGLLYGLYVPTWEFEVLSSTNSTLSLPNYISGTQVVKCNMRNSLEPPCNAVGFLDRFLLGEKHLYQRPVYRRTKECSVNSPDYGALPPNSPGWCLAPFDPEGILSSLMAATTCFFGLHYGHIIVHFKNYMQRGNLWLLSSFILVSVGYALKELGVPVSKPLYTLSYMCITTGASGIVFTIIYFIVDVSRIRKPTLLFQWMGMNALIVYALAACELFPAALQGFYWRSPENNLVNGTQSLLELVFHSKKWGTQVFVLLEIVFWGLVAGYLHLKGIYVKL